MNTTSLPVVLLALVGLASLPCLLALSIMHADEVSERSSQALSKLRRGEPRNRPIEESSALLRSLSAQLMLIPVGEAERREAVVERYDLALQRACDALELPHHLDGLSGYDADVERLRLESLLIDHGLTVRGAQPGRNPSDLS